MAGIIFHARSDHKREESPPKAYAAEVGRANTWSIFSGSMYAAYLKYL